MTESCGQLAFGKPKQRRVLQNADILEFVRVGNRSVAGRSRDMDANQVSFAAGKGGRASLLLLRLENVRRTQPLPVRLALHPAALDLRAADVVCWVTRICSDS